MMALANGDDGSTENVGLVAEVTRHARHPLYLIFGIFSEEILIYIRKF